MMNVKSFVWAVLCLFLATACSDKEVAPAFELKVTGEVVLEPEAGVEKTISFHSTREWQAAVNGSESWLTCSPSSGEAGDVSVTIKTTETNTGEQRRSSSLILTSGELTKRITIHQEAVEFVKPEQHYYNVPVEGGTLQIVFKTNYDVGSGKLVLSHSDVDWLEWPKSSRTVQNYKADIVLHPNPNERPRVGTVYFWEEVGEEKYRNLEAVTIVQAGQNSGESTDFSADKQVKTLQKATKGNGVPIVVMGDGFIDKEIVDGSYDAALKKAVENFFTEEPMASLREYFDIYAVTAVSQHNSIGKGFDTVFDSELEGGSSTLISGDDKAVMEYVKAVPDIDMMETTAIVILNTPAYAGTAYFGYQNSNTKEMVEFAVTYCPIIDDMESENFRSVLTHESVGHGFAKLDDEYSYEENGTMPEEAIEQTKLLQSYDWALNVDFTADKSKVLWSPFLSDDRYKDEGLGVFEGACTYIKGAYRSSKESMMNGNKGGFNAPSRKAIYDMVIRRATGKAPTYEEFVAFDRKTQAQAKSISRASTASSRPFARPQFMGGKELR